MNSCGVGQLGRAHDLARVASRLAVGDVLPDGRAKQQRVLQHEADLLAQRFQRELADVRAVDATRRRRIVEARNQANDASVLPAPDGPTNAAT